MLKLTRQPYGQAPRPRTVRLTAETYASLTYLAEPGLQAAAMALAVWLLDVAVSACGVEADELGEVLAAACGWETERLETGLGMVLGAVQRARLARDEAEGEMV